MENELVKRLCAKNGFEDAASSLINNADVEAFSALVDKSEFLFDFIKQNVVKRLQNCINKNNYKNLLKFLKIYSYDYEDLIVSNISQFKDEETISYLTERLTNGTDEEKAYCVKILDGNKIKEELYKNLNSEFEPLAYNCAQALGKIKDKKSFDDAIEKLKSDDDFQILSGVKFLSAYNDKAAIPYLFEAMKISTMSENIACEIVYLEDIFELLKNYPQDTLLLINNLINGLGEVVPISIIFDIQLFELLEHISSPETLLNIKLKIEQLTENDEYLFDEDKSVKEEIQAVKDLLNSKPQDYWDNLCDMLKLDNDMVFVTLHLISELELDYSEEIKELIENTTNQTVILKAVEVMKSIGKITELDKTNLLAKVDNEHIKAIIESCFQ